MVRLTLINEQGGTIVNNNVATINEVSCEVTLQIADVREPESGTGSFSKTIDIPGNPEVNQFFEDVYSVNVSLQTFNPNLKVRAIYYNDEIPVFEGYLQILSIELDEPTQKIIYKCNILGEVLTLFNAIKGKYLTDLYNYSVIPTPTYLPLSIYNHNLTANDLISSWAGTPGVGYVYPMIDRGGNMKQLVGQSIYTDVDQFAGNGCFYAKSYLDRIFQQAGFTYTSNFFDSTLFKRLIITPTKIPSLSTTILNNNKFLANINSNIVLNKTLSNPSSNSFTFNTSADIVTYQNEVYDSGNRYNNTGGIVGGINPWSFQANITKQYNVLADATIEIQFLDGGGVDRTSSTILQSGTINFGFSGGGGNPQALTNLNVGAGNGNAFSVSFTNLNLISGTQIQCQLSLSNIFVTNILYTLTTMRVTITLGSFSAQFSSPTPYEGQAIDALDMIPENYSQEEFLRDLRKLFNLYFTPDKTNPKNLIIEPRPDFYLNTALDWADKHDKNSLIEIFPVGELDAKKYKFTYTEDGDYFNKLYQENFKELYGYEDYEINNDFIKSEKEVKVSLAPTILAGNSVNNGIVASSWRQQDEFVYKEFKAKPRILYWAGRIAASNNATPVTFRLRSNGLPVTPTTTPPSAINTYPYAGHLDNPFNPSIDLNFGLVKYVYYFKPNQFLTNNNLYNKYYSQYINQITDKDSKIVKTRFYLTADDLHRFEFRYPVFTIINNEPGYYLVNKIVFNPLVDETSEVELLKLVDYPIFTPQDVEFNNGLGITDTGTQRTANIPLVSGENNYSNSPTSMIVGGSGNFIPEESESVMLIGSTDVQPTESIENFLGVGLSSSSEVISNEVNLFNNFRVTNLGVLPFVQVAQTMNADFTVDGSSSVYFIDLSTNDVTATFDMAATQGMVITFIITQTAGSDDFYIGENTGVATINGLACPHKTHSAQYDWYRVSSDGTLLYADNL